MSAIQMDISREILVLCGTRFHGIPLSPAALNSIIRYPARSPAMTTVRNRKLVIPHPKNRDPRQNRHIINPLPRRKSASPVITWYSLHLCSQSIPLRIRAPSIKSTSTYAPDRIIAVNAWWIQRNPAVMRSTAPVRIRFDSIFQIVNRYKKNSTAISVRRSMVSVLLSLIPSTPVT